MNKALLIILAIGCILDFYGEVLCRGALLSKINKAQMVIGTLLFGVWQLIMIVVGIGCATLLEDVIRLERMQHFTSIISILIFAVFAGRMFKKAWKNDYIEERRQDDVLHLKKAYLFAVKIGIKTGMIGLALGFLEISPMHGMIFTVVATALVFVLGVYNGYRFGYRHKGIVFALGFVMLSAIDIYLIGMYFTTGFFV